MSISSDRRNFAEHLQNFKFVQYNLDKEPFQSSGMAFLATLSFTLMFQALPRVVDEALYTLERQRRMSQV